MDEIRTLLSDYERLATLEKEVRVLHDRVCGVGAFMHEDCTPFTDDVAFGIRETIARRIGEHMLRHYPLTLEMVATKQEEGEVGI